MDEKAGRPKQSVSIGRGGATVAVSSDDELTIAVALVATTLKEASAQWRDAVNAGADLIEFRLDYLGDEVMDAQIEAFVLEMKQQFEAPVIATVRTTKEGGRFAVGEDPGDGAHRSGGDPGDGAGDYRQKVSSLVSWADALDIEIDRGGAGDLIQSFREEVPVIASFHQFDKSPTKTEMEAILRRMETAGASIAKVAWMVRDETDLQVVLDMQVWAQKNLAIPAVVIGMGEEGQASRLGEAAKRSAFTFAAVTKASAPGQPTIDRVRASSNNVS